MVNEVFSRLVICIKKMCTVVMLLPLYGHYTKVLMFDLINIDAYNFFAQNF